MIIMHLLINALCEFGQLSKVCIFYLLTLNPQKKPMLFQSLLTLSRGGRLPFCSFHFNISKWWRRLLSRICFFFFYFVLKFIAILIKYGSLSLNSVFFSQELQQFFKKQKEIKEYIKNYCQNNSKILPVFEKGFSSIVIDR